MAGQHTIYFSKNIIVFFNIIKVQTPLGYITFYIILINTLFLFYIKNINKLSIKLNNLKNILI